MRARGGGGGGAWNRGRKGAGRTRKPREQAGTRAVRQVKVRRADACGPRARTNGAAPLTPALHARPYHIQGRACEGRESAGARPREHVPHAGLKGVFARPRHSRSRPHGRRLALPRLRRSQVRSAGAGRGCGRALGGEAAPCRGRLLPANIGPRASDTGPLPKAKGLASPKQARECLAPPLPLEDHSRPRFCGFELAMGIELTVLTRYFAGVRGVSREPRAASRRCRLTPCRASRGRPAHPRAAPTPTRTPHMKMRRHGRNGSREMSAGGRFQGFAGASAARASRPSQALLVHGTVRPARPPPRAARGTRRQGRCTMSAFIPRRCSHPSRRSASPEVWFPSQ